jgi:hypothetical protein
MLPDYIASLWGSVTPRDRDSFIVPRTKLAIELIT